MSKIKKFMDTPITWGASCKATCIIFAFYGIIIAVYYLRAKYMQYKLYKKYKDQIEEEE